MRTFIVVGLVMVCGCSKRGEAPKVAVDEKPAAVAKPTPPAPMAEKQVAKPSADIPAWTPLASMNEGAPAKPVAWVVPKDAKATLAVFSASWCPGCTASALADRALVKSYGDKFQIGVALQSEDDDAFVASKYAQALSGVPVWSEASVGAMTKACEPHAIPSACLYAKGKVLWTGDAAGAGAALEAHAAGKLAAWVAGEAEAEAQFKEHAKAALAESDPAKIAAAVAVTHGRAGWQNSVAWNLVDREQVSEGAAALAVALSRDAVASDGGVDFAHLDTYALALAKAGRAGDAAYVGARVIEVCEAVQGKCSQEKQRAEEFIARANAL
jgi:hypothetical protein